MTSQEDSAGYVIDYGIDTQCEEYITNQLENCPPGETIFYLWKELEPHEPTLG